MKLTRSVPLPAGPLGLAALVNVVLLLLFFFLLGSSFVLQPGLAVTLPVSRFNLPPQVDAQVVSMQAGPPARIYYRDQQITIPALGEALASFRGSPRSIILRADRQTPYDTVVSVVNEALAQGFSVSLATAPPPEKP